MGKMRVAMGSVVPSGGGDVDFVQIDASSDTYRQAAIEMGGTTALLKR
jgi:hypothetical protein